MHILRTVVFSQEETRLLARVRRLINIGLPPASDPLVPRENAVSDDDPRRRALNGLLAPFDPISAPRLDLAAEVLAALAEQVERESDVRYWLGLADNPAHPQVRQMADVLATERGAQAHVVRDAQTLVNRARSYLDRTDDPHWLRDHSAEEVGPGAVTAAYGNE